MAWEISHTPIAWQIVRCNLLSWTDEQLIDAITDDTCERIADIAGDAHGLAAAQAERKRLAGLPVEVLVDLALGRIEEHGTCDNGGFNFYVDREGFHTVPCDLTPEGREAASPEDLETIEVYSNG